MSPKDELATRYCLPATNGVSPLESVAILTLERCWLITIGIVGLISALQVRSQTKRLTGSGAAA